MNKKILIIENDPFVCRKLKSTLMDESTDVEYALSIHEAFELLRSPVLCLVMIDIHLKETNGIELIKSIRRLRSIPILILSDALKGTERAEIFRAGAQGYIEKSYSAEECFAYVQSVIQLYSDLNTNKSKYFTIAFDNDFFIDPVRHQAILQGEILNLTPKEFDLLHYFARHPGQVLSREQLYNAIWNEDTAHSIDEVVKTHIKTLRKKLAPFNRDYIKNERGIGYRFSPKLDQS